MEHHNKAIFHSSVINKVYKGDFNNLVEPKLNLEVVGKGRREWMNYKKVVKSRKKKGRKNYFPFKFLQYIWMLLCYVHDHITFQEPIQQDIKNTFLRLQLFFLCGFLDLFTGVISIMTHHTIDQQDIERRVHKNTFLMQCFLNWFSNCSTNNFKEVKSCNYS